jgi:hypothetical protein
MAAGLGFKTFTTGEVLTAADVNGYLMQGINVFASSAARAAAITSPQEGQYSFLKDTNALEYYDGAAWVGAPVGDITAVTAGKGLTGGGSSGDVTVSLATTAKGDLVAGSGASTAAVLTVGSNGETLVADSSTSTGLRWQGDFNTGKNKIINGDFGIWQRGTSFSSIFGVYTADRYISGFGSGGTQSIAQQDVTGAAGLPNFIRYAMRYSTTSAATNQYNVTQRIEDVQTLAGQTVTFSFYARRVSGTGTTLRLNAYQIFGTGGSTFTQPVNDLDFTVTNSDFQRFSHTFTMPAMTGKTIGTSSYLDFRIAYPTAVSVYDVTGWQLEASSVATPFTTATGTLQGELAACQRYYYRASAGSQAYARFGIARASSTTNLEFCLVLPSTMRVAPTAVEFSTLTTTNAQNVSAAALNSPSQNSASIDLTVGSATTNQPYTIMANNSTSAYVAVTAEL